MNEEKFDLLSLWPEFDRLRQLDFSSPEGLSAAFVVTLLLIFFGFSFFSTIFYFQASLKLRFYRILIGEVPADRLAEKRRDICNKALENKLHGRLWREFDESLVYISQKNCLRNTLDAAHFFNSHTIARRLTENRLVAAVPGFLTAIGVIGTFAGLQMGLALLSGHMGNNPEIDALKNGIFGMIGGASIAFMSSVWGVFTSVAFNLYEKILERSIRSKISTFQNQVDYLYPRITAEQSLSNIEDYSRQSTEKLAELDEKIGHRLQEAMREASTALREGMEDSLRSVLGPAIEQLVNQAHSGSEQALERLLERFLEGIGSAGDAQKDMMETAARDVQSASGAMVSGLNTFLAQLQQQLDEGNTKMSAEIGAFTGALSDKSDAFVTQSVAAIEGMQTTISSAMQSQEDKESERQKIYSKNVVDVHDSQKKLSKTIENVIESQGKHSVDLAQQFAELIERFSQLSGTHEQAAQAMRDATSQLAMLGTELKSASEKVAGDVARAAEVASNVTQSAKDNAERYRSLAENLDKAVSKIEMISLSLTSASEMAGNGLSAVGQKFQQLVADMRKTVDEVQVQVAKILEDYATRVQDQTQTRLEEWNKNTNEYTSSMASAVRVLNDVVDEIDGKLVAR